MKRKKMARRCGNITTPNTSTAPGDAKIISDYDIGTLVGGIIIAVAFGLMFVWGAWAGW